MTSDSPVSVPAREVLSLTALQWGLAPLSPVHFMLPRDEHGAPQSAGKDAAAPEGAAPEVAAV